MSPKYVNTADLADHFGIVNATVRAMMRSGEIPPGTYVRMGRVFRFDLKAIEEHLLTTATLAGDDEPSSSDDLPYQLNLDLDDEADAEENPYYEQP
jgi:hypothetical protein